MNKQWPNSELLARLLNREVPVEDREAWDQDGDYEDLARILAKSEDLELPTTKPPRQAWTELQARIAAGEQPEVPAGIFGAEKNDPMGSGAASEATVVSFPAKEKSYRRYGWMLVAAAAAVLILAVVIPGMQAPTSGEQSWLTEATQYEHREIVLPDGSLVRLNAQSQLQYDPATWEQERLVRIEGEAYFEVAKGSRFTVDGPSIDAQVLGTRFNVFDREGRGKVEVFEGKVRTSVAQSNWSKDLVAGEFVENSSTESLEVRKFEASPQPKWLSGQFDYPDGAPLQLVWQELERQYGVELVYTEAVVDAEKMFYGSFNGPQFGEQSYEDNMRQALRTVVKTMGYQYQFAPGQKILITAR